MKSFLKKLDILRFAFFIFFFTVISTGEQAFFSNLPAIRSQVASVILASSGADPIVRANALIAFLDELQKEIDAINKAQQSAGQQGNILILDPNNPDSPALRFNTISDFLFGSQTKDKVLVVRNKTSQPISFTTFEGLGGAFSFKGGSFPGEGGNCKPVIGAGDCNLVFIFEPVKGTGTAYADGLIYRTSVDSPAQLVYQVGGKPLKSNALAFAGYGVKPANVAISFDNPVPILADKETEIKIKLISSIDGNPMYASSLKFGNVKVPEPKAPYSIKENTCGVEDYLTSCVVTLIYHPSLVGVNEIGVEVAYNDGVKNQKKIIKIKGEAASSDSFVKQVLVVFNKSDPESVDLKNYYIANRPEFSGGNVLAVDYNPAKSCSGEANCLSGEVMYKYWFKDSTINPIEGWIKSHPDSKIRYIVLMKGIPSRLVNPSADEDGIFGGVQYSISRRFEVLVTSLNMGSSEATKRYIDKLKLMYERMPSKASIVSSQGTGKNGTTYYMSDATALAFKNDNPNAKVFADKLKRVRPGVKLMYRGFDEPVISNATDVSGFLSRGLYGYAYSGKYAIDGTVRFSGNSGWYIIETMESFNGVWTAGDVPGENFQGNFVKWFSKNAFGGSNYENTPVGAVTHIEEPSLSGVNNPDFFSCWDSGEVFASCAWHSRETPYFQAVGDPLVAK
ncbi:MAG: hypothetical protein EXS59_01665 [Candidatus Taylorbacteria bacterium]|nr:hypothetical protein [Candidatus Taylorbacteria bacterium]